MKLWPYIALKSDPKIIAINGSNIQKRTFPQFLDYILFDIEYYASDLKL